MKRFQLFMFFSMLFGLSATLSAQEVIEVEAGRNTIAEALATASAGDTILLVTPGSEGEYIDTFRLNNKIDITIKGDPELSDKPVISCMTSTGPTSFIRPDAGFNLYNVIVKNFGYGITVKAPAPEDITSSDYSVRVDNCEFYDFTSSVYYNSDGTQTPVDSVIFTNCIIQRGGGRNAFYLKTTKGKVFPGGHKYFKAYNILITHIPHKAIYAEPCQKDTANIDAYPVDIIDHVTVDSCDEGIQVSAIPGAIVRNCIVVHTDTAEGPSFRVEPGRWDGAPACHLENSIYTGYISISNSYATTDTVNVDSMDVQFVDAANGDYSLVPGSPGTGAATDGKDIGFLGGVKTAPSGVHKVKFNDADISVYPNPCTGPLHISFDGESETVESLKIYNVIGKLVKDVKDLDGQRVITIDISSQPAGLYFGELKTNRNSYSFKVLKK